MKKIKAIKRLGMLFLSIVIISITCTTAFAEPLMSGEVDDGITYDENSDGIMPLELYPPTELTDLPYKAEIEDVWGMHYSEMLYYFEVNNSVIRMQYSFWASHPTTGIRKMKFVLFRKKKTGIFSSWEQCRDREISFDDTDDEYTSSQPLKKYTGSTSYTNLSSDYYYYLRFYNTTSDGGTSTTRHGINGDVYITEG